MKPTTGKLCTILESGRYLTLIEGKKFCELQLLKKEYAQRGYKNLKITY